MRQVTTAGSALAVTVQGAFAGATLILLASGWERAAGTHHWTGSALFTLIVAWSFVSWRIVTGRLVDGYSLFLLAFVLFNGGQIVLHAVGSLQGGPLGELFNAATIERAILVTNASLALLHLAALAWTIAPTRTRAPAGHEFDLRRLHKIGLLFVVASLPNTLACSWRSVQIVAASGYGALYQQTASVGVANTSGILAMFLTPGLLILLGTKNTSKWTVRLVWAVALLKAGSLLFAGQRGYAMMTLVPMVLLHHQLVRRVRPALVASVTAALLLAFPLLREVRGMSAYERAAALRAGVEVSDPLTNTISEMGGSLRVLAHTIELVPDSRDYDHGMGLLLALSTIVPNLFWDLHPAQAAAYSGWLVRTVDPWLADQGGGLGFSMVAEGFINFGPFGTPFFCGAVGLLVVALLGARRRHDASNAMFAAIALSILLFYPRSEASATVRALAWCAVLPYWLARRRNSSPASQLAPGM